MPGSEMKEAVRLAQINQVPLGLIDQDITITLRRFSKYFTFKDDVDCSSICDCVSDDEVEEC